MAYRFAFPAGASVVSFPKKHLSIRPNSLKQIIIAVYTFKDVQATTLSLEFFCSKLVPPHACMPPTRNLPVENFIASNPSLEFPCAHAGDGCPFYGRRDLLGRHEGEECRFARVQCPRKSCRKDVTLQGGGKALVSKRDVKVIDS